MCWVNAPERPEPAWAQQQNPLVGPAGPDQAPLVRSLPSLTFLKSLSVQVLVALLAGLGLGALALVLQREGHDQALDLGALLDLLLLLRGDLSGDHELANIVILLVQVINLSDFTCALLA
jgi:hypothetical protein